MRVPISWLREYVDLPGDAQAIADRLAMLGFPVAEIIRRPAISGVVVGKIAALEKHPNADRLQVGSIDVGARNPLTIATAATNVAAGQTIAVATIGAKLPLLTIEPRKMRGIDSQGMMISADELALPAEWFEDGIMQLDAGTPLGTDVVELFGLRDDVLDVEITSNRVDAMAVIGLARELAASYGVPLRLPSFQNPGVDDDPTPPSVQIESPDCTRFIAQRFESIAVAPAPAWVRVRLALCGQRPINNLVDVSNYVMFETGQPLHFYDEREVAQRRFVVRDARADEKLVTLDGVERTLNEQMLVIADTRRALGLAGLMGGETSEVRDSTRGIILESANFNGARVRRMSSALGLRTEASSRHEKAPAPILADIGAARAAQLLVGLGAHAFAPQIFGERLPQPATIELRRGEVARLLGLDLSTERIARHLQLLGCATKANDETIAVTVPAWRRDLIIPADLVEEVARMEGYDAIEAVEPQIPAHAITSAEYALENKLASALAALGYHEIVTYALQGSALLTRVERSGLAPSHRIVHVLNPLTEEQRVLRWALGPGMFEYFARIDRPYRVFELGHVFTLDEGVLPTEAPAVAFGFAAEPLDEPPWHDTHFLHLKGDVEALIRAISGVEVETTRDARSGFHPGKSAVAMWRGQEVAAFGKIDPRLSRAFDARLPLYMCSIYLDKIPEYQRPVYRPPSRYPSTYRDLAIAVGLDVDAERIGAVVRSAIGELCTGVRVFDEYRGPQAGEGRKSIAVRATMRRYDGTITDEEADAAIARAVEAVRNELGGTIRR
ncbi:MAG TPA: phenylalanine--tRNA ligase subunit beta [Candidatus Baltobacteraceae bacterium]|nr:phenylalanine--tRNA ligase subunit beta [Candidatus Baltobacteraceae bacterium]